MPYARTDGDGRLLSLHREAAAGNELWLEPDDPRVLEFLAPSGPGAPAGPFARLDADFVRVIEDVIDTLIMRNVINLTDLPAEAQAKLLQRKGERERAARNALTLFAPGAGDGVV